MSSVIIGTAGHIDHGKTSLVKALTGIDTDRLKEEKKRGITIELGFAHIELESGQTAGIVDVPGHEKFIANMLAGASGIDIALLIIAADDGIMPQTREHLGILSLLGIKSGIVVLTKADLVEPEWLEMIGEDIRKITSGTFLESSPIVPASSHTGQGLSELRAVISKMAAHSVAKPVGGAARIPVDRVFTMDGFGTVITGTMIEGEFSVGDEIEIYPSGVRARIRGLQVHSKEVSAARAGHRVAVNLAAVGKTQIVRGDIIAAPGSMLNTLMLDVKVKTLPDSDRIIKNGSRLHFYHGARESLCKIVLLNHDQLLPGEEAFAQLRFTEHIAVKKGDRFVMRFYSPLETVGGGVVLDPNPKRRRRYSDEVIAALSVREEGSLTDNILQAISDGSPQLALLSAIRLAFGIRDDVFRTELDRLAKNGRIMMVGEKIAIDSAYRQKLERQLIKILEEYHRANPMQDGMHRDELRSRLLPGRDALAAEKLLAVFAENKIFVQSGYKVALAGFEPKGSLNDQALAEKITGIFLNAGCSPPSPDEVMEMYPKDKKATKKVIDALLAKGILIAVSPHIYFHREVYKVSTEGLFEFIAQNGQITLAQARDLLGSSRKYVLAILEYLDRHGVTKKIDDARILVKKQ